MKQNTKLHIGLSTDLKNKLQKKADECDMTLNQYCLFILAKAKPKIEYENNT